MTIPTQRRTSKFTAVVRDSVILQPASQPSKEQHGAVWVTSLRGFRWRVISYFVKQPHCPWMRRAISNIYTCILIEHVSVNQPEHRCSVNSIPLLPSPRPPVLQIWHRVIGWNDRGELTSADGPVVTPGSQRVCNSLTGDTFGSLQHVAVVTAELHAGAHSVRRHGRKRRVTRNNICGGELTAESPRCSSGPSRLIGSGVFSEPWFPRRPLLFTRLYFSMF